MLSEYYCGSFEHFGPACIDRDESAFAGPGSPRSDLSDRSSKRACEPGGCGDLAGAIAEGAGGEGGDFEWYANSELRGVGEGVGLDPVDEERELGEGPFAFDVPVGLVSASIESLECRGELCGIGRRRGHRRGRFSGERGGVEVPESRTLSRSGPDVRVLSNSDPVRPGASRSGIHGSGKSAVTSRST